MTERITSLLSDLARLVRELDGPVKTAALKGKTKEVRLLEGQIVTREPETVLASKLTKAIVSSADGKRIGEVSDLIIKADGQVSGVVIGVGDSKRIALKVERFKVTPEPDGGAHIMLGAKMEELQQAPDFKPTVERKSKS